MTDSLLRLPLITTSTRLMHQRSERGHGHPGNCTCLFYMHKTHLGILEA